MKTAAIYARVSSKLLSIHEGRCQLTAREFEAWRASGGKRQHGTRKIAKLGRKATSVKRAGSEFSGTGLRPRGEPLLLRFGDLTLVLSHLPRLPRHSGHLPQFAGHTN
jgi:hypothetical protein